MEQYIVAIDPGTSKMVAMIARKETPGNKISILQTAKVDSENCIRRGWVYNVEATAEKMEDLINRLYTDYARPRLNAPIERVYVGIGGQSVHTERYSIRKPVEGGTVKQLLVNQIKEEIEQYKPELYEVLEILPPEYYVDGQLTANPVSTTASVIEARYQLIVVSNPNLKNLIRKAVPEKIAIEYVVAPLATAAAVLEPKEKDLGCALVEFGAGVTTVSIYKNRMLRFLVTIPLGGLAITKDLRCLNVLEEEAESLKIEYGRAVADTDDTTKITIDKGSSTPREIGIRNLNTIIEARVDEILENVIHQITESGYADSLGSGLVITGGGATLRYLEDSFRNKINKNLRMAYPTANGTNKSADLSTIIGMINLAKNDCVETAKKENTKEGSFMGGIFDLTEMSGGKSGQDPVDTKNTPENTKRSSDKDTEKKRSSGNIITRIKRGFDKIQGELFDEGNSDNENDNNEKSK